MSVQAEICTVNRCSLFFMPCIGLFTVTEGNKTPQWEYCEVATVLPKDVVSLGHALHGLSKIEKDNP